MKACVNNLGLNISTNIDEYNLNSYMNVELKIYLQPPVNGTNEIGEIQLELDHENKTVFLENIKIFDEGNRNKGIGGIIFDEICNELKNYGFEEITGSIEDLDDIYPEEKQQMRKKFYLKHGCTFEQNTEFTKQL